MAPSRFGFTRSGWAMALLVSSMASTAPAMGFAQVRIEGSLGGRLESLSTPEDSATRRVDPEGSLGLDYGFGNDRGRVFYDLDAGRYDAAGDWSFWFHRAGASWRIGGDAPEATKLFLNASASVRRHGDAWADSSYEAIGGGINAEYHVAGATLRAGYRADHRAFSDLSALSQTEQRLFVSLHRSFASRTTLILEVQGGAKHYAGTITEITVAAHPDAPDGATLAGAGMGHGYGRNQAPSLRIGSPSSVQSSREAGTAGLVTLMGRVAQSLSNRVGLYVQGQLRATSGAVTPALITTPAGFVEDGIYDDPFASRGRFVDAGVSWARTDGASITAGVWLASKDYEHLIAAGPDGLDAPGSPLRSDRITKWHLSLVQPVAASRTGPVDLAAELGYRYIDHDSNDAFSKYRAHSVTCRLTVTY